MTYKNPLLGTALLLAIFCGQRTSAEPLYDGVKIYGEKSRCLGETGRHTSGNILGDVTNSTFSGNVIRDGGIAVSSGGAFSVSNFWGSDGGFADFGGTKFLSNSAEWYGGAIYIHYSAKIAAYAGDLIFQGNIASNLPNAVHFRCHCSGYGQGIDCFSLGAFQDRKIYFYDQISSAQNETLFYGNTREAYGTAFCQNFTIAFNPESDHGGTIIFDTHRSDIYFESDEGAKVSYGTLALHNGASFGATNNEGKFTIGEHATLRVAYGQERREYILNEDKSFTETDPSKIIKSYPPYNPAHVSCINAGKVNFDGAIHFVIPQNICNGNILLRTFSWSSIWGATVTLEMGDGQTNLKKGDHVVLIRSTWLQGFHKNSIADAVYGEKFLKFYLVSNSKELWAVLLEDPRLADADSGLQMHSLTLSLDSDPQAHSATVLNGNYGKVASPLNVVLPSTNNGEDAAKLMQNPQNPAFSESYLQGMILIGTGSDLVAGPGMADAVRCAGDRKDSAFGAFSFGIGRWHTGSHVDTRNVALLAGFSRGVDMLTAHRLTWGGFLEYATSIYDTHNEFTSAPWVDGDGRSHCLGGGILARSDLPPSGKRHFYLEGSGRAGRIENHWGTDDIREDDGIRTSYRASTPYRAFHGGIGCIFDAQSSSAVDVYGKCFWAIRDGTDIRLRTDDPIAFNPIESIRLRCGAKYSKLGGGRFVPHAGIALEHEFSGKSKASTYGMQISPPSLGGNNCLGELGIFWKSAGFQSRTFNFDLQGSAGTQMSVKGNLAIRYAF